MSPTAEVALFAAAACFGLAIAWSGFRPRPASLAADLDHLYSPPPPLVGRRPLVEVYGSKLLASPLGRLVSRAQASDLRVLGRTPEEEASRRAAILVGGLASGPVLAALTDAVGTGLSPGLAVGLSAAGCVCAVVVPARAVSRLATTRRRAYRWQLAMFLLAVTMCLSAGYGIETALKRAVKAGRGGLLDELDKVMGRARLHRQPPWPWLRSLGGELALDDLTDLAENVALAGDDGASIRETVIAKADALMVRILTEDEAEAGEATEAMHLPTVVLLFAFIAFAAIPAMSWATGSLAR